MKARAKGKRGRKRGLFFLIDGAAADDGLQNFHVEDLFRRGLGQVLREDNEISIFADLQIALFALFKLRVRRANGVRVDAIIQRDFLLRLPSAGRATLCLLYTSPSPRDLSTSRMPSSA